MDENRLSLHVLYRDIPDLIQLGVSLRYRGWFADSSAYVSPKGFAESACKLLKWLDDPSTTFRLEGGADTGIGWLLLEFYVVDRAGHIACAVNLATQQTVVHGKHGRNWRVGIVMATEFGLVEQFAHQCISIGDSYEGEAELKGLPC